MDIKEQVSIFWFRRDLRFEDNTGLIHALNDKYPVLPVFIFDPNILEKLESKKDARVEFILNQVLHLKDELEQMDSTLQIFHCDPDDAFRQINETYDIKAVYSNRDYEPLAIKRDLEIKKRLQDQGITFYHFKDHVIFEGNEVLKPDGTPYKVFTPFKKKWLEKFEALEWNNLNPVVRYDKFLRTKPASAASLEQLGFEKSGIKIPEKQVKQSLITAYENTRNFPAQKGTSKLGIHFRFGTISIREKTKNAKNLSNSYLSELIWREFYSYILQHFPFVATEAFNKKYNHIPWRNNQLEFRQWCEGKTGYPLVDAGMRELNQTGFMHNRSRMITASFLTKHLLIDWRWGEAYFASKLIDFDLASNNGGWQWAAGTGTDAQPYFRVFNPESQAQKFDPNKEYIQKWVPEIDTTSYPNPIVEHKFARNRAIETYRTAVSNFAGYV